VCSLPENDVFDRVCLTSDLPFALIRRLFFVAVARSIRVVPVDVFGVTRLPVGGRQRRIVIRDEVTVTENVGEIRWLPAFNEFRELAVTDVVVLRPVRRTPDAQTVPAILATDDDLVDERVVGLPERIEQHIKWVLFAVTRRHPVPVFQRVQSRRRHIGNPDGFKVEMPDLGGHRTRIAALDRLLEFTHRPRIDLFRERIERRLGIAPTIEY